MAYLTGVDIDLVYLWVDGSDPAWLAKKLAATGEFHEGSETDSKARYENSDELRYSLRSVEKFAPWIRKIFIVTDNQVPAWLDTSNPRIRIVDHKEILPPEALPCFNSSVIEYALYRIPDLAEHFLYANDDMFFGKPLTPGFFFAPDGYPIVRLRRKVFGRLRYHTKRLLGFDAGHYRRKLFHSARLIKRETGRFYSGVPHHNIDAYLKSDHREVVERVLKDDIERSQLSRTRTDGNVSRAASSLWSLAVGRAHRKYATQKMSCIISVNNPDYMAKYLKYRPALFCLNDNQWVKEEDRKRIKPFLESLFPDKSSFEK